MKDLKEQVLSMFRFCEQLFGVDIESKLSQTGVRSGTLGTIITENDLFSVWSYIQSGDYEIAYELCHTLLVGKLSDFRISRLHMIEDLEHIGNHAHTVIKFIKDFTEWKSNQTESFKQYLFANNWLKESEKTDKIADKFNWLWINNAKKAIRKGFIKTYSVTDTQHQFELKDKSYVMPDVMAITSDPIPLIPNPKFNDDVVHVNVFMKIENILDYSYFIFTFQYKNELYVATDKMNFSNPRVATSSRNPRRHREDYYDNVDLPYNIIDDVIEWRKENGMLTKNPGQEIYVKQISEYLPAEAKICLRLIIEELLYGVIPYSGELKKLGYASQQVKLIGDTNLDSTFTQINL